MNKAYILFFGLILFGCNKSDFEFECVEFNAFETEEFHVLAQGEKQDALLSLEEGDLITISTVDSLGLAEVDFGAVKYKFTPAESVGNFYYWISGCPMTPDSPAIPLFVIQTECFELAKLTISTPDFNMHRESVFLIKKNQ